MTGRESPLQVGDRVRLVGDHPWSGSSGRIIGSVTPGLAKLGLAWEIALDEGGYPGHQVAASLGDLLPERRATRAR